MPPAWVIVALRVAASFAITAGTALAASDHISPWAAALIGGLVAASRQLEGLLTHVTRAKPPGDSP